MGWLVRAPSVDDVIRLLRAWHLWLLAVLTGALIAAAIYAILPPPYRARAVVNVDFNLEQAWPQQTDRQQFYYLERETRKLEEIAWSDPVMQEVATAGGASVTALRGGMLQLSQPAEAGWHFYADDVNAQRAQTVASAWARAFVDAAKANLGPQGGLNSFIRVEVTQAADLPTRRSVSRSAYLLAGSLGAWFLAAVAFLFFDFHRAPAPPENGGVPG